MNDRTDAAATENPSEVLAALNSRIGTAVERLLKARAPR